MKAVWDYDPEVLKKTEKGRILLLERQINYGPEPGQKISLELVRNYWKSMNILPRRKKLLELFLE